MYRSKSLTLLEIVIAGVVLTIAFLGVASSIMTSVGLVRENQERTIVAYKLKEKIEEIRTFAVTGFDSLIGQYGVGSPNEFFDIYPLSEQMDATKAFLPPVNFRVANGGTWQKAGRVLLVMDETVTEPDVQMVMDATSMAPMFPTGAYSGSTDVQTLMASTPPGSFKVWYVVVTGAWVSPTGRERTMSYQTFISNR